MQRVVRAIECAGFAMGELAKEREDINKTVLNTVVKSFLEQLQVVYGRVHSVYQPACSSSLCFKLQLVLNCCSTVHAVG
jgi:hypothetical protein